MTAYFVWYQGIKRFTVLHFCSLGFINVDEWAFTISVGKTGYQAPYVITLYAIMGILKWCELYFIVCWYYSFRSSYHRPHFSILISVTTFLFNSNKYHVSYFTLKHSTKCRCFSTEKPDTCCLFKDRYNHP